MSIAALPLLPAAATLSSNELASSTRRPACHSGARRWRARRKRRGRRAWVSWREAQGWWGTGTAACVPRTAPKTRGGAAAASALARTRVRWSEMLMTTRGCSVTFSILELGDSLGLLSSPACLLSRSHPAARCEGF